ncbi:hypothetical protein [Cellulomonas sp. GbtcB1]|uniref:hypothetical protein n=1 Tax=Cellulomonas sp. GbtcB1 TaxID=2824746 RepID=UPI001C2F12EE|nr:hypothetical protein [Cellulomonas sp. GbtcB1]
MTVGLVLTLALALASELIVQTTSWSRLPVLIVVLAVGHLLDALIRSWIRSRSGRDEASHRLAERPGSR